MNNTKTVNAADVLEVVNPFDQKAIESVTMKSWAKIDAYLKTAYQLQENRKSWLPNYRRIEIPPEVLVSEPTLRLSDGHFASQLRFITSTGKFVMFWVSASKGQVRWLH